FGSKRMTKFESRSKKAPIAINDRDGTVKREAEEENDSMVNELKEKLEEAEGKVQKLIKIGAEKQARIENLEDRIECLEAIVDQKHDFLKEKQTEELEKSVQILAEENME
ncbi:hypothetical protein PMAYCL1PPCAC_26456, partial [Pristionchus mayeri]